jgi:hypothetical protein
MVILTKAFINFILIIFIFTKLFISKLNFIILIILFDSLILEIFKLLFHGYMVLYTFKIICIFNNFQFWIFVLFMIRKGRTVSLVISRKHRSILKIIIFILKNTLIVLYLVLKQWYSLLYSFRIYCILYFLLEVFMVHYSLGVRFLI